MYVRVWAFFAPVQAQASSPCMCRALCHLHLWKVVDNRPWHLLWELARLFRSFWSSSVALFVQGSSSLSADLNLQDNKLSQISVSGLHVCTHWSNTHTQTRCGLSVPGGRCIFRVCVVFWPFISFIDNATGFSADYYLNRHSGLVLLSSRVLNMLKLWLSNPSTISHPAIIQNN